ncbi:hypothetical protein DITRI_Ditri05aG0073700 [Diplodiscus trichospermus]
MCKEDLVDHLSHGSDRGSGNTVKSGSPKSAKSGSVNRSEILSSVEDREDLEDLPLDPKETTENEVMATPRQMRAASVGVADLTKSLKPWKKDPIDKGKGKASKSGPIDKGKGPFFNWSNRQAENLIAKKLDRVLINEVWQAEFPHSTAKFLYPGVPDHCLALIQLSQVPYSPPKPFKFINFWIKHPDFSSIVQLSWQEPISGNPLMILHKKNLKD